MGKPRLLSLAEGADTIGPKFKADVRSHRPFALVPKPVSLIHVAALRGGLPPERQAASLSRGTRRVKKARVGDDISTLLSS